MKKNLRNCFQSIMLFAITALLHSAASAQTINATLAINKNITYQKVTGFGGFVNSPQFAYDFMTEAEIRQMWGAGSEGGYNIMRMYIPIGETNWPQALNTALLAKSLGIKIFASPWSMPAEWKTYPTVNAVYPDANGVNQGNYLNTANYADYANYLNNFVTYLRNNGVELDAISIQNEPDEAATYAGCLWTPAQIATFLKGYRSLINCKVIAPESVGLSDSYANALLATDVLPNYDIYAGHQYGGIQSAYKNIQAKGKEAWMTEYLINWNSGTTRNFSWSTDAFTFANSLNNAMLGNVNAWIHYATKRYYGLVGDGTNGSTPGVVTKRGKILSQFAKFIVGATRVDNTWGDNTGILGGSAYLSATGDSLIVEVINNSANSYNVAVSLPFLSTGGKTIRTTATEDMVETPVGFTESGRPKVSINPSSVTTLVFIKSNELVPSQMTSMVINYDTIDNQTVTNPAFGTGYQLSGKTVTFRSGTPLISTNTTVANGYLKLQEKFNKLVFSVATLSSASSYTSSATTLYYINSAGQAKSYNYGTINFNSRSNFLWALDISENVLTDGCTGILGITTANAVSILTFKFNNVYFAVGNERGYKFAGPYSGTDNNLLSVLDDSTYTSIDFNATTAITPGTDFYNAVVNKNCVYYATDGNVAGKTNIIAGTGCNNLTLSDMGGDFYPAINFTANAATYQASLHGYKMLVLPFDAAIPVGVKAYTLQFADPRVIGQLMDVSSIIPANTPVLVYGTGPFTFTGSGNVLSLRNPRVGITNGVFMKIKVPLGAYYLTTAGGSLSFTRSTSTAQPNISSFDAYLIPVASASSLSLVLNESALPVELGAFNAKQADKEVRLNWNTYAEINNAGFDVERSADGNTFGKIGFVKGNGTSSAAHQYSFTDYIPLTGTGYYRLKQIDADGNARFSPVKTVRYSAGLSITLYPNPVKNTLVIDGNGKSVSGRLVLFDAYGKLVLQQNLNPASIATLDVSILSAGVYIYRVGNFNGTFIKQ